MQLAGLAVPVRLVNVAGLRDVDRVVDDNVGVAPRPESRVPVAKVGENGLDGLTSCRRVVRADGFVADGEGAGGGPVVDESLLGGGGLLLHHDWFPLSVLVCSLVDVFYCSTNAARLSTRVDKGAVVWGAVRRVDTLLWACYCWCCQRDALGFVLACSVEFFACRLILVGRRILTPLIQVRVLAGELRSICAHVLWRRCFSRWRCA